MAYKKLLYKTKFWLGWEMQVYIVLVLPWVNIILAYLQVCLTSVPIAKGAAFPFFAIVSQA